MGIGNRLDRVLHTAGASATLLLWIVGCGGDGVSGLPDASRDRIVFSASGDSGNYDLYTMDQNGSGLVRLTTTPTAREFQPAASPDGSGIAFVSDVTGRFQLYVMNVDGSNVIQLTGLAGSAVEDPQWPAWSPDGRRILYTSYLNVAPEIFVMNADGSGAANLTNDPAQDYEGTWSPDGRRIAFVREVGSPRLPHIHVMDFNGGTVRQLTSGDSYDFSPSWAPDGREIVFVRRPASGAATQIFSITVSGTGLRPVTDDQAPGTGDARPSWSRDGTSLLFSSTRGGSAGNYDIWISQPDSSRAMNLTQSPLIYDTDPHWVPVP
jgi:Tol biopolymer transport system component